MKRANFEEHPNNDGSRMEDHPRQRMRRDSAGIAMENEQAELSCRDPSVNSPGLKEDVSLTKDDQLARNVRNRSLLKLRGQTLQYRHRISRQLPKM